jgi:hypothetical protein
VALKHAKIFFLQKLCIIFGGNFFCFWKQKFEKHIIRKIVYTMKKSLIFFFSALAVTYFGCRDNKEEAAQMQIARLQAQQDSARRADEEKILALKIKAREDSIAMSSFMTDVSSAPTASTYYVVVGSFLSKGNANAYLRDMKSTFGRAQIVTSGRWNYVCVGGQFGSFSSARATLNSVKSQLVGGGSGGDEDEEYAEEDGEEDEEYAEEDEEYSEDDEEGGDEEDYDEEEEDSDYGGGGGRGQAWVLGL